MWKENNTRPSLIYNRLISKKGIFIFSTTAVIMCALFDATLNKSLDKSIGVTYNRNNSLHSVLTEKRIHLYMNATIHRGKYKRRMPQCLIIGALRAGTDALKTFLNIHPHIVVSDSETRFWSRNFNRGASWYIQNMPKSFENQITIEESLILDKMEALRRLRHKVPDMKLLVIVTDPVFRALSHYNYMKGLGIVRNGNHFHDYLYNINGTIDIKRKVVTLGIYWNYLNRLYEQFPDKQIHVVDGGKFVNSPLLELGKIEKFLGLEHKITRKKIYFDRKKGTYCFERRSRKMCLDGGVSHKHVDVKPSVLRQLGDFYHPYNLRLFKLLNRRLTWESERAWYQENTNIADEKVLELLKKREKEISVDERKPKVNERFIFRPVIIKPTTVRSVEDRNKSYQIEEKKLGFIDGNKELLDELPDDYTEEDYKDNDKVNGGDMVSSEIESKRAS